MPTMRITVFRLTEGPAVPTHGVLLRSTGVPFALTLERPWLANRRGASCIPRGRYQAKRILSPRWGETFLLGDVPGRSEILFHPGNLADDSAGCILVGERFQRFGQQDGIGDSREGFTEFMELTAGLPEITVVIEGRGEVHDQ